MYIKNIPIGQSVSTTVSINVNYIYTLNYHLYQVEDPIYPATFYPIISGDLANSNCLYLTSPVYASSGYATTVRFCPSQVLPAPVNGNIYCVQILVNQTQSANVDNQFEDDLFYRISDIMV